MHLFAVFDGHGGILIKINIIIFLKKGKKLQNIAKKILKIYLNLILFY